MKTSTRALGVLLAALGGACATTGEEPADASGSSSAITTTTTCPSPFAGHDTPENPVPLGGLTDGDGYQPRNTIGSIAIGQTAYFRLDVVDVLNLRNPKLAFAAHSVYRAEGREDVHDTADASLDVDVTYVCDAGGTSVECGLPSNAATRGDGVCPTMWGGVDMKVQCAGLDETGYAIVRVTRRSIAFPGAQDVATSVPRACGLTYVGARNLYASALPK